MPLNVRSPPCMNCEFLMSSVLAVKEPTLMCAFGPTRMPLGLIRKICPFDCIVPSSAGDRDREVALNWIDKTIARTGLEGVAEKRVIEADHIAGGLVKAGTDYDMIVLGASREGIFSSVLLGEITEKVARHSRKPVMIVKRYEGVVKSMVRKVLG